jgi:hypothetical protein
MPALALANAEVITEMAETDVVVTNPHDITDETGGTIVDEHGNPITDT